MTDLDDRYDTPDTYLLFFFSPGSSDAQCVYSTGIQRSIRLPSGAESLLLTTSASQQEPDIYLSSSRDAVTEPRSPTGLLSKGRVGEGTTFGEVRGGSGVMGCGEEVPLSVFQGWKGCVTARWSY